MVLYAQLQFGIFRYQYPLLQHGSWHVCCNCYLDVSFWQPSLTIYLRFNHTDNTRTVYFAQCILAISCLLVKKETAEKDIDLESTASFDDPRATPAVGNNQFQFQDATPSQYQTPTFQNPQSFNFTNSPATAVNRSGALPLRDFSSK
jgi:hypothetical protein